MTHTLKLPLRVDPIGSIFDADGSHIGLCKRTSDAQALVALANAAAEMKERCDDERARGIKFGYLLALKDVAADLAGRGQQFTGAVRDVVMARRIGLDAHVSAIRALPEGM